MIMKTILALIMSALVSHIAQADGANTGDSNYVKLPDYNPNAATPEPAYNSDSRNKSANDSYGDDSYGADTYTDDAGTEDSSGYNDNQNNYQGSDATNYVENNPAPTYSGNDNWGQVKAACDKRNNDPYRLSGQLSPLRIQIICTQYSSIDARIQAKGMDTYSVKSKPVRVQTWKKDVLCEDLVQSRYDLNILCAPSNDDANYDDNQTYQDTEGQGS